MGNCQAVDAAALVIQHPSGKQEMMYWPITASEVMKTNPGHYVSLIIPLSVFGEDLNQNKNVRYTRVKLLRPNDTLVMNVLKAKKHAKTKKKESEIGENLPIRHEKQSTGSRAAKKDNAVIFQSYVILHSRQNHGGHLYRASQSLEAD
ncbi:UPF0398 protein SPH_0478, partial [Striga asiatica]